jgi:diguanylate cyclase (GGDEF)-like protein
VRGTSWRLLTVAPSAQLLAPLSGPARWIPWIVLLAFALASSAAAWLLRKLILQKAQLAHQATRDPLTGALNRRTLERSYRRLAFEAERAGSAVGVLTIDLDHFKDVNDVHGHAAGDDVLRRVAETLLETMRPSDVVARIGGDEFVVLLASVNQEQADMVAARVVQSLARIEFPAVGTIDLRAKCSAGIALAGQGDTMDRALARADGALYEAKAVGRDGWRPAADDLPPVRGTPVLTT